MPPAGEQVTGRIARVSEVSRPPGQRASSPASETPTEAARSMVVIVAATRAEQARLLASLPPDVAVLLAPTVELAEQLLQGLSPVLPEPARPARPVTRLVPAPVPVPVAPQLSVRAEERSVCVGDRVVRLTRLEFALLRVLSSEVGRVWSFAELIRRIWGTGYVGDGAQVRAVVKRLRRKLADVEAPVAIETIRAAGFRLVETSPAPTDD
ncbi:winged helix-turn-helix domain-containing protein [Ornithinimicrobium sp. Y1694]|uniref:winged helix-turn-helix domain-containing protein n=1 Tax=Ornithinimicrobium sp. Y1694 TaxID=3418590 RepID=UPI003CECF312